MSSRAISVPGIGVANPHERPAWETWARRNRGWLAVYLAVAFFSITLPLSMTMRHAEETRFRSAATPVAGTSAAAAASHASSSPCAFPWWKGTAQTQRMIGCLAARIQPPGGAAQALRVANCESRFLSLAYNPTGCGGAGCLGIFQQHARFWSTRASEFGLAGASAYDARANAIVSMKLAVERGTWAIDWPVCAGP